MDYVLFIYNTKYNSKLNQLTYGGRRQQPCSIINNVGTGREHHTRCSASRMLHIQRGLLQHLHTCRRKNNTVSNVEVNIDNQSAVVQKDLTRQD